MQKIVRAIAITLATAFGIALIGTSTAAQAVTHFANCTAMHHVYPHGVSKSAAAAQVQVNNGYGRPAVRPKIYAANISSDRDKDGTACEA